MFMYVCMYVWYLLRSHAFWLYKKKKIKKYSKVFKLWASLILMYQSRRKKINEQIKKMINVMRDGDLDKIQNYNLLVANLAIEHDCSTKFIFEAFEVYHQAEKIIIDKTHDCIHLPKKDQIL